MGAEGSVVSFYCGACGATDLTCMNRERLDRVRCCRDCNGHGIEVTDKGRAFITAVGHPHGDGITVLQMTIEAERRGVDPKSVLESRNS